MSNDKILTIDWAMTFTPQPGNIESGDGYSVQDIPQGKMLAVIDGLGHGPKASIAARAAEEALKANPQGTPDALMQQCHRKLISTRGAVISIASFNAQTNTMIWTGVGNVTSVLVSSNSNSEKGRDYLLLRGGIVGYRLPPLRSYTQNIHPGDVLILATDGIRKGFIETVDVTQSAKEIADHIHGTYNRQTDDALVLVARFLAETE
jgi:phosphoserine phosphatase RsbX